MGKKKATVGERIELNGVREALCRPELTIDGFRTGAVYAIPRKRAKAIDRAIRKAAKDAATAERERIVKQLSDYEEAARRQPQHAKALTLAALVKIAGSAK